MTGSGAGVSGTVVAEQLRAALPLVRGRSPLYERLLSGLAGAAERGFDGGVLGRLLATDGPSGPVEARLLLLAALHHAALRSPDLPHAAWFPTAVTSPRPADDGAPAALALAYLLEHEDEIARFLATRRLQTNEIGRCAALLPGLLTAAGLGSPLRLVELGCSAGLNLYFDRYRYRYLAGPAWGPEGGPEVTARAEGSPPRALAPPTVDVADRLGVDLHPIDVHDSDAVRLLRAFAWPDERDRHGQLDRAIEVARAGRARLVQADLLDAAAEHARPVSGVTTVIVHSQVRHLLTTVEADRLADLLETSLRAATRDAPLAYVAFEAPRGAPYGQAPPELVVAIGRSDGPPDWSTPVTADWHGRWVRWY